MAKPNSFWSPVIPDDLVVQILSLLPVKTLMRFRCASKSWETLISKNPSFVKLHLKNFSAKHTTENILLTFVTNPEHRRVNHYNHNEIDTCVMPYSVHSLFQNPSAAIPYDDFAFHLKGLTNSLEFVDSCNGLVCLSISSPLADNNTREYRFLFWNPATRSTSSSPSPLFVNIYDDVVKPAMFGFGYDSSSDTYKLVATIFGSQPYQTTVLVHTMGHSSWRNISSFLISPVRYLFRGQVHGQFVSGTLNWLGFHKPNIGHENNKATIVSFDLGAEKYKQLFLPEEVHSIDHTVNRDGVLAVMRNSLYFLNDNTFSVFTLWKMKKFGDEKSWTQVMNFHLINNSMRVLSPLWTNENDDVLMLTHYFNSEVNLYRFGDNKGGCMKVLNCLHRGAKGYFESLVMPC